MLAPEEDGFNQLMTRQTNKRHVSGCERLILVMLAIHRDAWSPNISMNMHERVRELQARRICVLDVEK